jgi:hypothetical protein
MIHKPAAMAWRFLPLTASATATPVLVYEAERIAGPDGAVERGDAPITDDEAISRLKSGGDIVVCSSVRKANRNKARELTEAAFHDFEEDLPHQGRMALPHFHPASRSPEVHAFFEAPPRHARKRKTK